MELKGQIYRTNIKNWCKYEVIESVFNIEDVTRWGKMRHYGINGQLLVAEIDGEVVRVPITQQTKELQKILRNIHKRLLPAFYPDTKYSFYNVRWEED